MKVLISPIPLLIAVVVAAFALSQSSNASLWTGCLLALPLLVWIAGGRSAPAVLLWIVGISWLQIIADVFLADLSGQSILDDPAGTASQLAIIYSLAAIAMVALGMRCGNMFGKWVFRGSRVQNSGFELPVFGVTRLILCYLALLAVTQLLSTLGNVNPLFLQPIIIVVALKYVVVYLIAITVFESEENYLWLVFVAGLEVLTGVIAYFASYKESIFIILIAMASSRRPLRVRNLLIATIACCGVIWMSLVWTAVKRDYRNIMFDMSFSQKLNYMAETYFADRIDYHQALEQLINRIGYTKLYARVIEMDQEGSLARGFNYYEGAIKHILTPRILFSDKPALDDSRATLRLLGMRIAEGTSIGVGYVAEAHVDFGFPGLLVPMGIIGFGLGLCWQYFATRPVPHLLGEAFGVSALFNSFLFAANIDKSVGSFFTIWLAFGLILAFGYPAIRFVLAPLHDDGVALAPGELTHFEFGRAARSARGPDRQTPASTVIVLGLNAFHGDSSAALLRDGVLVAAAEEERFRRVKHWAGFPAEAIRYCLREAGLRLADVDHVAVNQDSRANLLRKLGYFVTQRPDFGLVLERLRVRGKRQGVRELLAQNFPGGSFAGGIHAVEHHLSHLSSAFHVSPFARAAVVSVDGFGDFASAAWGLGEGTSIDVAGRVFFPHSLGIFYQALTQYLGFPHYGDEYKVMGLAPYGKPSALDAMRQIVRLEAGGGFTLDLSFFRHHRERISFQWEEGAPQFADLFSAKLERLLGPRRAPTDPLEPRHHDIARSAQAMYEEAFFHLLGVVHKQTGATDIALAGGCAMNSVANGKIRRQTPFRRVYVQAAAGDAGGAIGAAFALWHRLGGARSFVMDHASWGPHYGADEVSALLAERRADIAAFNIDRIADEAALCSRIADAIAAGKVVGWFEGRMEWGPRALGNRSIVCDPRRADMKEILNAKIKRRESFRPFAPSVLAEAVADWFEEDDAVPFMMQVFQIRADKRAQIPAVTHVDGSGRLQTVTAKANPRYHRLIEAFNKRTGVPMVLNTSFNENEPIVCTPAEALDCFLRTSMDVLVLGDTVLAR